MANPNLWSDDKKRNKLIEEYNAVGNANPQNITEAVEKYQNRKPFSYNYENDPMYANLREAAMRNGQMAMKDTMGKATALTGGYMNSYAQRVGQSAYNQYMDALNDKIPQLEQTAYERYRQGIEDDIKNIDIQQMLYNIDQKGKDAQRDAIANQIGFREDAMKQDYPLMNLPYTNEQAYNQKSRLDRMETNNNIYEYGQKEAIDRQYKNSSGTQNINNTYEYYNNLMEKGLIDEAERDARIKATLGLTSDVASSSMYEKGSTDYNRVVKVATDEAKNGHYDDAGNTLGGYAGKTVKTTDAGTEYAKVLKDAVASGGMTREQASKKFGEWVAKYAKESDWSALYDIQVAMENELKTTADKKAKEAKKDEPLEAWKTKSNDDFKATESYYYKLYNMGEYRGSWAQFWDDLTSGKYILTRSGELKKLSTTTETTKTDKDGNTSTTTTTKRIY